MTRDDLLAMSRQPNTAAFLRVIRACEGTAGDNGYRMHFGGSLFDSFADHPRRVIHASGYSSSAAGAYQFLGRTWLALDDRYQFPSFEPQWQDAAAVALIAGRGALEDVRAGRLDAAVAKCALEWASLPGSPYGQPTRTLEFVRKVFAMHGGREPGTAAPIEARTAPPQPVPPPSPVQPVAEPAAARLERLVSPFVLPALDILARVVPTIADLFKGETPSRAAERNVDAVKVIADKVIPMVITAAGAPNIQAAAESAQADPAVARQIDDAARREYHELSRVSLKEAREFGLAYSQIKDVRTVVGRFTFIEFLSLVLLAMSTAFGIALLRLDLLKGELLGAIVMLVVVAGFVEVRKYWLGLPAPELPKDEKR